jgi:hypothetical protein
MDAPDSVVVYAVGDVYSDRPDPASIFLKVTDTLKKGDVTFCQLESPLSHTTAPSALKKDRGHNPDLVACALKEAGFNVVSFASNHCMEDGLDAFLETIDSLRLQGCQVVGCGGNITEARRPAVIECSGKKIAFLAFNSVGVSELWAQENKPGCAPLRARPLYEPLEPTQPGTPVRIHTFPYREDVRSMAAGVQNARSLADAVIVSMHAGVHITRSVVADYQIDTAHAAIDAGADLVLQHHAHILKGIEVYRGKAIFYGLGNFALEIHFMTREWADLPPIKELRRALDPNWHPPYQDYPSYPFPPDSRKTVIVKCLLSKGSIDRVSFLPAMINNESQPEILHPGDDRFREVVDYIRAISREAGFSPDLRIEGEEVLIST